MRKKNVLVVNGHPDASGERFCAALAAAYLRGAGAAGHPVRRIDVGALDLPAIRSRAEFEGPAPDPVRSLQAEVAWADHLVLIYPLWLGGPPAIFKTFLEQVFRYGFALGVAEGGMKGLLKGKSARVIVTMGMPAPVFRLAFDAPGLKAITRGVLLLCGFWPVRATVVGEVEGRPGPRTAHLARARRQGAAAA